MAEVIVNVRYYAGARAASGVAQEKIELDGASAGLTRLVEVLAERRGPELARVLAACSFLVDEVAGGRDRPLRDGAQVDVLPPFAGG